MLLLLWALLPTASEAVVIDSLTVLQNGARYSVTMNVQLDASADVAYSVLSDYQRNLPRMNHAVVLAQLLPETASPDVSRLHTQVRMCFSFFCKTLDQVQDMRQLQETAGGHLSAQVLPDRSDLKFGQADWRIHDCRPRAPSCLEFTAELEPKFWIPPLIGPWIMERKLRQEAIETSEGIERLARETPPAAAP